MPGCRAETKRRGIDLGLIAMALLRSATVARAGGRGRVTLCAGPAPCGDGLWQREGQGGHLACGHAAPASAAASYQATKKEVPTYSPISKTWMAWSKRLQTPPSTCRFRSVFQCVNQPDPAPRPPTIGWILMGTASVASTCLRRGNGCVD